MLLQPYSVNLEATPVVMTPGHCQQIWGSVGYFGAADGGSTPQQNPGSASCRASRASEAEHVHGRNQMNRFFFFLVYWE